MLKWIFYKFTKCYEWFIINNVFRIICVFYILRLMILTVYFLMGLWLKFEIYTRM